MILLHKKWIAAACGVALLAPTVLSGCGSHNGTSMSSRDSNAPVSMSPPVETDMRKGQVFDWNKVTAGQKVPLARAEFDKEGYQLYGQTGEEIIVPFDTQNKKLDVMKFARTDEPQMYFVNQDNFPTLYIPNGGYLTNAAENTAKWYPFTEDYKETRPVAVAPAPNWNAYQNQAYYPGMASYGGYFLSSLVANAVPMIGLHYLLNSQRFNSYGGYQNYYQSHPAGAVRNRTVYNYKAPRSTTAFGTRSASGFGGSYSGSRRPGGSFGSSSPSGFGSRAPRPGGSFGSSPSGFGGSFGRPRSPAPSGGLFGGGGRSSGGGGLFGGGRSSGGSFGGGRSFGGGGFGRGRR